MTSETAPGSCSKIVDLLLDYLEGRLSPDTRDELDRHLSGCPSCVSQLRTYRTTVSMLRKLRDQDLSPELRSSVQTFLEGHTTH